MATSNAATTYLERRVLDFIFKNNSLSFATPGNNIYVGLATAVSSAEKGNLTEVQIDTDDADYTRQQVTAANWKQSVSTLGLAATSSATVLHVADAERESVGVAVLVCEVQLQRLGHGVPRTDHTELLVFVPVLYQFAVVGLEVQVTVMDRLGLALLFFHSQNKDGLAGLSDGETVLGHLFQFGFGVLTGWKTFSKGANPLIFNKQGLPLLGIGEVSADVDLIKLWHEVIDVHPEDAIILRLMPVANVPQPSRPLVRVVAPVSSPLTSAPRVPQLNQSVTVYFTELQNTESMTLHDSKT